MAERTFADLTRDLRMRRTVGDKPPVLLLGAGASVDAGIGAMPELYEFFNCADFDSFAKYIETVSTTERYRYLAEFLQTRAPDAITPGYGALASLCAQNYFDLVLTTNMDPLLDDALAAAKLWRRDYLLLVNGIVRPDRIKPLLQGQSPRVKVIKLHGDLFQRYMAWTVGEMDEFLADLAPQLTGNLDGRDFLVVGYSLRDQRVRQLVESAKGAVWFTHPSKVPEHLADIGPNPLPGLRSVIAPECAFEKFFPALLQSLDPIGSVSPPPKVAPPMSPVSVSPGAAIRRPAPAASVAKSAAPAKHAYTVDDLIAASLAVASPDGQRSSTAFLLSEPRILVCDAFAAAGLVKAKKLKLISANGTQYTARVLAQDKQHPFGPMLLDVPADLKIPGLQLDATPPAPEERVQVAVASGERIGLSDGKVVAAVVAPFQIIPIEKPVKLLTELDCLVAPGSSGAPVVSADFSVRGFIVAGSTDPKNPRSFMYPTSAWAGFVKQKAR